MESGQEERRRRQAEGMHHPSSVPKAGAGRKRPRSRPLEDGGNDGVVVGGFAASEGGYTNERLLGTAFLTFMGFALVQMFFAVVIAESEAMVGDSAAMMVDALTYLFNFCAERMKKDRERRRRRQPEDAWSDEDEGEENENAEKKDDDGVYAVEEPYDDVDLEAAGVGEARRQPTPNGGRPGREQLSLLEKRREEREERKFLLRLEIVPPLISVTTLVAVTVVVLKKSVTVLILDMSRDASEQRRPDVRLMLIFSVVNLVIDGVNVFGFFQSQHLLGFPTTDPDVDHAGGELSHRHHQPIPRDNLEDDDAPVQHATADDGTNDGGQDAPRGLPPGRVHGESSRDDDDDEEEDSGDEEAAAASSTTANLNMCSAYTHVFADTLRSFAVIIAASVAMILGEDAVTPEVADAAAAIVVSALIFLSLVPLARGLFDSLRELRAISVEEKNEKLILSLVESSPSSSTSGTATTSSSGTIC